MPILRNKFAKLLHNGIQYRRVYKGDKIIVNTMMDAEYFSKAAEFIFDLTKGTSNTINLYDRWKASELEEIAEITANFAKTNPYITDWGDGTQDFLLTHTYKQPGSYTVKTFYHINNVVDGEIVSNENTIKCLTHVNKLVDISYTDLSYLFNNCTSLQSISGLNDINTSNVSSVSNIFNNCTSLISADISMWNITNLNDVSNMFNNCSSLTSLNLSTWNTNGLTSYTNMFNGIPEIQDWYYDGSNYNEFNLTEEDTSYVYAFPWSEGLSYTIVSNTSTDPISSYLPQFTACVNEPTEPKYYITLTDGSRTNDLSTQVKNVQSVKVSYKIAEYSKVSFSGNTYVETITELIVNNSWTSMEDLFRDCTNLVFINTDDWDTSNVTTTLNMFKNCSSLVSFDLSNFNFSNMVNMRQMFLFCSSLTEIKGTPIDISNVENLYGLFYGCTSLTSLDLSGWTTSNKLTDVTGFAYKCNNLETINFTNWNTENVTKLTSIFTECYKLTEIIGFNELDFSNVTDMENTFMHCTSLVTLDLSNLNVNNVTNMKQLFYGCTSLTSLNLSTWDTSKVTDMYRLFSDCTSLSTLNISNFNTSKVTNSDDMFLNVPEISVLGWGYDENNYTNFTLTETQTNYAYTFPWNCYVLNYTIVYSNHTSTLMDNNGEIYYYLPYINIDSETKLLPTALNTVVTMNDTTKTNNLDSIAMDVNNIKIYYPRDTYSITFSGSYRSEYMVHEILEINVSNFKTMRSMFKLCTALTSVNISGCDTSEITDMGWMFYNCIALTSVNISGCDTSKVTDMSWMFRDCSKLTELNLSGWNTENVTSMNSMFYNCTSLDSLDLSNWNTDSVTDISFMFYNCTSLTTLDVSNFNTSNVTTMGDMFYNCTSLTSLDLSNFDTSNANNIQYMFYNCTSLTSLDLSKFDTRNIPYYGELFTNIPNLEVVGWNYDGANYANWTLTEEKSKYSYTFPWNMEFPVQYTLVENTLTDAISTHLPTFTGVITTTVDTTKIYRLTLADGTKTNDLATEMQNVSKVEILYYPDSYRNINFENLNQIKTIDKVVSSNNWRSTESMFKGCTSLVSVDLSNFDTSNVTNMGEMFRSCTSLTTLNLTGWNTTKVNNMQYMFTGCTSLESIEGISNFDTSNVVNMDYLFNGCRLLSILDLSNWKTNNVTNMNYMFNLCNSLSSLDLSNFDTKLLKTMRSMMTECTSLVSVDVSGWDTSNVTDMYMVFGNCTSLTSIIGITNWSNENVTDVQYMFKNCSSLSSLDLTGWNTNKLERMDFMFDSCTSLVSIDLSTWNTSGVETYNEVFKGCRQSCIGYYGPTLWTLPQSGSGFNITWVAPYNEYTFDVALLDSNTVNLYNRLELSPFTIWGDGSYNRELTHEYDTTNGTEFTIYTKLFNSVPLSTELNS